MTVQQMQKSDAPAGNTHVVPRILLNLIRRIAGLPPGHAYAITLWMPEDASSEPVWTLKELGKIENQR